MADPDDPCAIYVGGISFSTDEERLRRTFAEFGEIVSSKVIYDRDTRQPRGFGFVVFATPKAASTAMREMDGKSVDGRTLRVSEVKKRDDRGFNRNPPFKGGFRDRDRGYGRRSPGPGRGGRGRSPGYRRSYSPRRSPRRSSPSDRHRSRTPPSRSPTPPRKDRLDDAVKEERQMSGDRDHPGPERTTQDYEDLRDEVESLKRKKVELTEKVKALEAHAFRNASNEETMLGKVERMEGTLKQVEAVNMQRSALLKKMQRAVLKLQDAEEQRKESEKELKALTASLAVEVEAMDGEG